MNEQTVRPNLFIVGAPKCGTSSMHDYLSQHPDVFMSAVKEPGYFTTDLDVTDDYRTTDEAAYLALFTDAKQSAWRGESTTSYLRSPAAPGLIHAFSPDSRIVIMLRQPVDLMYSMHGQNLWTGNEDIRNFEAALAAEADRRRGERLPRGCHSPTALCYRDLVDFVPQIERWLSTVGRGRVHIVLLDDLQFDANAAVRDVLAFLGVTPGAPIDTTAVNAAKPLRGRMLYRMWKSSGPIRSVLSRIIGPDTRRRMIYGMAKVVGGTAPPPIDPRLRAALTDEMRPRIDALARLLGRDLSHWCEPRTEPAT